MCKQKSLLEAAFEQFVFLSFQIGFYMIWGICQQNGSSQENTDNISEDTASPKMVQFNKQNQTYRQCRSHKINLLKCIYRNKKGERSLKSFLRVHKEKSLHMLSCNWRHTGPHPSLNLRYMSNNVISIRNVFKFISLTFETSYKHTILRKRFTFIIGI